MLRRAAPSNERATMTTSELFQDLTRLRDEVTYEGQKALDHWAPHIGREDFLPGARNLAHYLALRRHDRRDLQQALLQRGLSSLGRCEARVLPNVEAVLAALARIEGVEDAPPFPSQDDFLDGVRRLELNTAELLGPEPESRRVRVMVTLPSEAAKSPALIHDLLLQGMDVARINCAHDSKEDWKMMIGHVRTESDRLGRPCRVLMDLAGPKARTGMVKKPEAKEKLHKGDTLTLVRAGQLPKSDDGWFAECLLDEAIDQLELGAQVWIDDGKVGGTLADRTKDSLTLNIFRAPDKGFNLKSSKGLNFPGSALNVTALTPFDLESLDFLVKYADLVGYSFVQSQADVQALLEELERRGDRRLGIIAKIETERAVGALPEIIVSAAGRRPLGVMIARGDLAVEIGWERISEIQEELLWLCEAAHVPVVWATQVLESLVKKGAPSRAEVTDAAMGERAECVMLNKGPYIREGLQMLVNVLKRMQEHQHKKMPRLRALRSWRDTALRRPIDGVWG